jgi:hypothetical protein
VCIDIAVLFLYKDLSVLEVGRWRRRQAHHIHDAFLLPLHLHRSLPYYRHIVNFFRVHHCFLSSHGHIPHSLHGLQVVIRLGATPSLLDITCMPGLRCHWLRRESGCVHLSRHMILSLVTTPLSNHDSTASEGPTRHTSHGSTSADVQAYQKTLPGNPTMHSDSEKTLEAWKHEFEEPQIRLMRSDPEPFTCGRRLGGGGTGIVYETLIDGIALALKRTCPQKLSERDLMESKL